MSVHTEAWRELAPQAGLVHANDRSSVFIRYEVVGAVDHRRDRVVAGKSKGTSNRPDFSEYAKYDYLAGEVKSASCSRGETKDLMMHGDVDLSVL